MVALADRGEMRWEPRARRVLGLLLLCLMLAAGGGGCAANISTADEIQMGREVAPQFEKQFGGLYQNPQVQRYVQEVGMSMAAYSQRPDLPWQFGVLNSNQVNAFALPGGRIYITRGLLERLNNEAQLAGVLGHEVGHVAERHTVQQIARAQNTQLAATGAGILGAIFGVGGVGDVAGIVGQLSLLKYGRAQERDADMSGLQYMARGGYNPEGMVQTMAILERASGGKGGPSFLSSHPNPGNRQEYLREAIDKRHAVEAREGVLGQETFQRRLGAAGRR